MKNKINILGIILILLSLIIYINKIINNNISYIKENKIIDNFNKYNDIGYIEIKKYNIRKIIKNGINKEVLDNNYVGIHPLSDDLDGNSNIILAGHNIDLVFRNLHKIKINDEIKLVTKNNIYKFRVYKIDIISKDNYDYFNKTKTKTLTLVTCTEKNKKRLIIRAC